MDWFYFGCDRDSGHYLFTKHRQRATSAHRLYHRLTQFDGSLAPIDKGLYVAAYSSLGGIGMSALAWWDQSVDTRPGSNSIVLAPVLNVHPNEMLAVAQQAMPWVFERLPRPLVLLGAA